LENSTIERKVKGIGTESAEEQKAGRDLILKGTELRNVEMYRNAGSGPWIVKKARELTQRRKTKNSFLPTGL